MWTSYFWICRTASEWSREQSCSRNSCYFLLSSAQIDFLWYCGTSAAYVEVNDSCFSSKSPAKLNWSKMKIAIHVFSLVFKACCKIKHSNCKLKISFLWGSLSGRKTKRKQKNLSFRKAHIWAAGHQKQHQCKEHKKQPPLSQFAQLLDCQWPCCHFPNSLQEGQIWLAAKSLCWGPEQWGWLSHRPWGFPSSPALPKHTKLLPVPKAWWWQAVMGKRAWERSAMPPQKKPLGVQWSRLCFYFNSSDSL